MVKNNIVLIGFMGCGKTTIGTKLAYKLKYSFIDSDKEIESHSGTNINQIFDMYGEAYFRKLENEVIKNIYKLHKYVIATGGGIIKNKSNIDLLKQNGIILYLKASASCIYNNIKDDESRPLLKTDNKILAIENLLSQRTELYTNYSDLIIDVDNRTVDEVIDEIIKMRDYFEKSSSYSWT